MSRHGFLFSGSDMSAVLEAQRKKLRSKNRLNSDLQKHVFLSKMRRTLFLFVLYGLVTVGGSAGAATDDMNAVAERYAHLVLALGQHDPDYVDAFYGPAEWKTQAEKEKKSLDAIGAEAAELIVTLAKLLTLATSCFSYGTNICRNKLPRWLRESGC